jgi:uncharacterized membrane protein YbaN (DUF454 family)
MRRLPGVTFAGWSKWTENLLILFSPRTVSEKDLLAEMLSADVLPAGDDTPAQKRPLTPAPDNSEETGYVTGWRRILYKGLGWVSVGLAVVGFAVPGIPGTPFVILAGYFFIRSSPRSHAWLRRSRWFGPILRDWEQYRGVPRSLKYAGVFLIALGIVVVLVSGLPPALIGTILALEVIGILIVLRLRVVDPAPSLPALTMG